MRRSIADYVVAVLAVGLAVILPSISEAQLPKSFSVPQSGYLSNLVIDIIEHDGAVWLATGKGLNFSYDQGETWQVHDVSTGMVSDNISALFSTGWRLWAGTNHSQLFSGELYTVSDGISYTDDNGFTFSQIDFSSAGQDIPYVLGGDRIVYDITGHGQRLFFAGFAGGFLASVDDGENWRRIYSSALDSIQYNSGGTPDLQNLYFSCRADSSRGDSLIIWAGTAGGIYEYVYAPPREKVYSRQINSVTLCDECADTGFVFYGGDDGIVRGTSVGGPFFSRFEADGLPGPAVSSLIDFRGRLLAGTYDPESGRATDLAYSDDRGNSFDAIPSAQFTEADTITGFATIGERLYMAAQDAGLFVSEDTGMTWEKILIDSIEVTSLRNTVNAVFSLDDLLLVGTDTGLASLYCDTGGAIDSVLFHVFAEHDSSATNVSSTRVMRVKAQSFYDDTTAVLDSLVYWTVNRPLTPFGRAMVGRRNKDSVEWREYQWRVTTNDINFMGDTAFTVGEMGVRFSYDGGNPRYRFPVIMENELGVIDSLGVEVVTTMEVRADTVIFGTDNGFAVSNDRGETFQIYRANINPVIADTVINYNSANNIGDLVGDFIPVLGVQYIENELARVWASNRHTTYFDRSAISMGRVLPVDVDGDVVDDPLAEEVAGYSMIWEIMYEDGFAWNYAFNGDSVFAATAGGLLFRESDTALAWDTVSMIDDFGEPLILPGSPVYAVGVVGDFLWVGTEQGTVRLSLGDLEDQEPFLVVDSTTPADEVYAYPVPFSHTRDLIVDFHFTVEQDAQITLEIYDFAMNLVSRVVDNQFYPAGIYPQAGTYRRTWDGYNGKGEQVAVGMYYFKVEYSSGVTRWGKLAVIP